MSNVDLLSQTAGAGPDVDLTALLSFAHELADAANPRLLAWFGKAAAGIKRDGTIVTEADLEVDRLIHQAVQMRYPAHGLLTEETSRVYAGAEYTWIIDPLDGTNNFAHGLPHWGASIGLLHRGEPLLGVLDFPLLQQRFHAVRGHGAWRNGQPLRCEPLPEILPNDIFTLESRGFRYLDIQLKPKARILGAAAYDLAAVASGVAVGCIETTPHVWDLGAVWLILREAGAAIDLLFDGVALFPLQPGLDYADLVFPLLATADPALWPAFRDGIRLKPVAERWARALEAQGWRIDSALRSSKSASNELGVSKMSWRQGVCRVN